MEKKALSKIKELHFSRGNYQIHYVDPHEQIDLWILLYLDERDEIVDLLFQPKLNPSQAERILQEIKPCLFIHERPIHQLYEESFWYALFWILGVRTGFSSTQLELEEKRWSIKTKSKEWFSLEAKTMQASKLQKEWEEKEEETEENSIKFNHLSKEELALWKEGAPSYELMFELSAWGDLAHYFFIQDIYFHKAKVDVSSEKHQLPQFIFVENHDFSLKLLLTKANWPTLIPYLSDVNCPLTVFPVKDAQIDSMQYLEEEKGFEVRLKKDPRIDAKLMVINQCKDWNYLPGIGFLPKEDPSILLQKKIVDKDAIFLLQEMSSLVKRHCSNVIFHSSIHKTFSEIYLDEKGCLHIQHYLFEKGDLQQKEAAFFGEWVYLPQKGFYELKEPLHQAETVISFSKMPDFLEQNRIFLSQFEGFQTHFSSEELETGFQFDPKKGVFFYHTNKRENQDKKEFDYGSWFYVNGKGFYKRKMKENILSLNEWIPFDQIIELIRHKRESLEAIKGFLMEETPIEQSGLQIRLNRLGQIEIKPKLVFKAPFEEAQPFLFDHLIYVPQHGFYLLSWNIPKRYLQPQTIEKKEEALFIEKDLARLQEYAVEIDRRLQKVNEKNLRLTSFELKKGRVHLSINIVTEHGKISLKELIDAKKQKRSYLISDAGLFCFKEIHWNFFNEAAIWQEEGSQWHISMLDWIRFQSTFHVEAPKGHSQREVIARENLKNIREFQSEKAPKIEGLHAQLRPYQLKGLEWLWFLYQNGLSGLLCDEMGLGKTHQAMALITAIRHVEKGAKILVICPTSVIYHWEDLLKRFLPKERVLIFYGQNRKILPKSFYDILLTTYGTIRVDFERLKRQNFQLAVYDEIQSAKNVKSITHKMIRDMPAGMRLGLTGTPIENRLSELKAIYDIVLPGYFPSQKKFREFFVTPIEKHKDKEKKKMLSDLIKPFLLRRKKSQVLKDLPEKIEEVTFCGFSDLQRKMYKDLFNAEEGTIREELKKPMQGVIHAFAMINKLKMLCDHPALINKDRAHYDQYECGKWDLFKELLYEILESGQKLVVFTQYLEMLDILEREMQKQGIGYALIQGSTKDRREQLRKFKEEENCKVFLASLKAVGVGVDLVSASVVIHYDRWWNPAVENQATDRVHRFGQKRGVQVYKLVTRHTVEEHIDSLINKKLDLFQTLIRYDDEDHQKAISREELQDLFDKIHSDIHDRY